MAVRALRANDLDQVVGRVRERLHHDAQRHDLLCPTFSSEHFSRSLSAAMDQTWVAVAGDRVVGHLSGALLDSAEYGNGVWIGPDGVSFDHPDVLDDLYSAAGARWIERGALQHYAWVFNDPNDAAPWYELGFARMHLRGVLALEHRRESRLPAGYALRRGGAGDLSLALALDAVLDDAQREGPSFSLLVDYSSRVEDMREALEDHDIHHYVVEHDGVGVAQCLTFALDPRRGSFEHTLHVSAVAVRQDHRHRGVARAMIDHALNDAREANFGYAETNWRVTNRSAARFWQRYGFRPTYVRLHRTINQS